MPPPDAQVDALTAHQQSGKANTRGIRTGLTLGLGFPRPLSLAGFVEVHRYISVGAEYSMLPPMTLAGADMNYWAAAGDVRVHPFHGAFFVGLRGGYQHLNGSAAIAGLTGAAATETATTDAWFVNPRAGFLFTFDSGLALGIDAGVQIPFATQESTNQTQPVANGFLRSTASASISVMPTIDFLRIGFVM